MRFVRVTVAMVVWLLPSALLTEPAQAQEVGTSAAGNMTIGARVGASYLNLPETRFSLFTDTAGNTIAKQENHDGEFWGARIDLFARTGTVLLAGIPIAFGASGFYAGFDDSQTISCRPGVSAPRCGWSNIVDEPGNSKTIFSANQLTEEVFRTSRDIQHWGTALAVIGQNNFVGLTPKAGLSYRAINQDLNLKGLGTGGTQGGSGNIRTAYDESLDTSYFGGMIGVSGAQSFPGGFSVGLDAEIGLYHANADYDGHYTHVEPAASFRQDSRLSLDASEAAVIASLRLTARQNFGAFSVGVFGEGEYYSWAPEIQYNDTSADQNRAGFNTETRIVDGEAYSATVGIEVAVPLN